MLKNAAVLTLCVLSVGCATTPKAIDELPELPDALARDLVVARSAPVLISRPATSTTTPPPVSPPPALAPARACTTVYEGYVVYPITVCNPPSVLFESLIAIADTGPPPMGSRVPATRNYKLTSHPLTRLGPPWFCTVRSGPWYARVEGAQICNVDPNIRSFTAQLLGAPEPVVVIWSGALTDVPPPLVLTAITASGDFCTCCSGVMCPNGNCVPKFENCGVKPPALK
jgi:hypothetical protein